MIGMLTSILLLAIVTPSAPLVSAANIECTSDIESGTFDDNVVVPEGETCGLYALTGDITINGNLTVEKGATLLIIGEHYGYSVTITGNIKADDAERVSINGVSVGGNIQVKNTQSGVDLSNSNVVGNVQISDNLHFYSVVTSNIGGNLQVMKNSSDLTSAYYFNFAGNTVGGNLDCSQNNPAPVSYDFGPNSVTGTKKNQCANL